ncbi:hypothetical protein BDQ17DRAFT_1378375 [Cyathus striatus]|nr:hypothetical protein BDQ17DRAFT_1378375 [Cyathus striatus]
MDSVSNKNGVYYGLVVSLVCLGVVILQCWNYFTGSFKDRIGLRLFVTVILTLSIISSCINIITVHDSLLIDSPDDRISKRPDGVHCFFASRIFLLTKKWLVPTVIVGVGVTMLDASVIDSSDVNPVSRQYLRRRSLFHGFAAGSDIIVSISFGSVTRGLLLATVQICHLIMFLVKPYDVFFWIPLHMVLDQLYTFTTCTLNSRKVYRERSEFGVVELTHLDFATISESQSERC